MATNVQRVLAAILAGTVAFYVVGPLPPARAQDIPDVPYYDTGACGGADPLPYVLGDLNGSDHVDVSDLLIFARTIGKSLGDPGFNPEADFNCDSTADGVDLLILAQNWGI